MQQTKRKIFDDISMEKDDSISYNNRNKHINGQSPDIVDFRNNSQNYREEYERNEYRNNNQYFNMNNNDQRQNIYQNNRVIQQQDYRMNGRQDQHDLRVNRQEIYQDNSFNRQDNQRFNHIPQQSNERLQYGRNIYDVSEQYSYENNINNANQNKQQHPQNGVMQQTQRRKIFNNIDDSYVDNSINSQIQNKQYKQQQQQHFQEASSMESSIISAYKDNLNDLAELYYTSEYDQDKVFVYELTLSYGKIYPGMNEYEKRQVYLESIDKVVNRIEKLQNYGEQIKDQINENALQNQHTLAMGTELIKVVAGVTDNTLNNVQKARIKLQNYKILYAQKLKNIQTLVKRKKRMEYVVNFLQKFQMKYSTFIYSAKIAVTINNLNQFEDLLILLDSVSNSVKSQSSSFKILKCLQNAEIYTVDKINSVYECIQNYLSSDIFVSFDSAPLLKINLQPFNLDNYKSVLRAYYILERHLRIAQPLSKVNYSSFFQ